MARWGDVEDEQGAEGSEDAVEAVAPAKPKRRKLMIAAAGALVLAAGGGGAAYAFLGGGPAAGAGEHADRQEEGDGKTPIFVDVPPMVVNLRSADGAQRFVKLRFMLVPGPRNDAEALTKKLPLLLDAYQPYLRELRPEDLAGSAAVFRIKEEMLVRAHDVLGEGRVTDVLIQDLIQQ